MKVRPHFYLGDSMKRLKPVLAGLLASVMSLLAQGDRDGKFQLALPAHNGQLRWSAEGFKIVQNSAKPNGQEIGVRAQGAGERLSFLGFLFLFPELTPLSSGKCRDGVMGPEAKANPSLTILESVENETGVALVRYSEKGQGGQVWYKVRGFLAQGDLCGDLEVYSKRPIRVDDAELKAIFDGYVLDGDYKPVSRDIFLYAQILFDTKQYKGAAPLFEAALAKIEDGSLAFGSVQTGRRVIIDQAGMSYGIAGDLVKARAMLEKGIAQDPEYAMFYYNLACADAEEKKLNEAKVHLKAAFARKANVIQGEVLPDPTQDDSFTPYKENQQFWSFVKGLQASR
jgi:tetratricopeptide (TPR) repeat protein